MKPNYAFAKRQRDLAKKQKKEEKLKRKLEKDAPVTAADDISGEGVSPAPQDDKGTPEPV